MAHPSRCVTPPSILRAKWRECSLPPPAARRQRHSLLTLPRRAAADRFAATLLGKSVEDAARLVHEASTRADVQLVGLSVGPTSDRRLLRQRHLIAGSAQRRISRR